jgi:excisionase family DNA binding protein
MPKSQTYTTLAQAAAALGLAPRTLRIQAEKGRLHAVKVGRDWLLEPGAVEQYRREHLRSQRNGDRIGAPAAESQGVRDSPGRGGPKLVVSAARSVGGCTSRAVSEPAPKSGKR